MTVYGEIGLFQVSGCLSWSFQWSSLTVLLTAYAVFLVLEFTVYKL